MTVLFIKEAAMGIKVKDKDFIKTYRTLCAEERLNLMFDNYNEFPKIIRKMEVKTKYCIKSDKEYARSRSRGELGVRVQGSGTSDPTFDEASTNIMIDEAFEKGKADRGILSDLENAGKYEADIRIIGIMRMDYELLTEIIEGLGDDVSWMKEYLTKKKMLKEIASDRGISYETIKHRAYELRCDIREEIVECLEMNCRGGM